MAAYSLLTLFALMGDQYLVYAITSVVSMYQTSIGRLILIYYHTKLNSYSDRSNLTRACGDHSGFLSNPTGIERTREEELSIRQKSRIRHQRLGYGSINPISKSSSSTITRRSNNIHQNKRAKLASLTSLPTPRYTTTPSPPPPPTKSTTVDIPTDLVTQNQSFVFVLVENLPMEASLSSIIFFFQNGSDIYKSARTHAQKTDALNGKLSRFKSNSMKLNKGILKFNLTQTDLTILKKKCESDHQSGLVDDQTKSILVRFPRLSSSSDLPVWNKFINEFQDKKFLVCDLLCPPLKCSLI
ncbi:hypothetical protein PSTT_11007 [Puccinia striiformis]|uniref:Uncharacterized protein n=1 Tax=Puccinia striiformis TaxID=27350 RepID=A0A2S4V1X6_9BASI|nr:hypothetical protein PSTT_11007 [Puccinia striiformis]